VGPQGPAGPGLELDLGEVVEINWPHGGQLTARKAADLLGSRLHMNLNRSLSGEIQERQPQIVQVWVEPVMPQQRVARAAPIVTVFGKTRLTPQTIDWNTPLDVEALGQFLLPGSRVLIRVHMGTVYDGDRRPFSSMLRSVLRLSTPPVPGGVLESWFFIR
jgi:hypothetical protein